MSALQVSKGKVSHKLENFAGQSCAMKIQLEELGLMAVSPTDNAQLF